MVEAREAFDAKRVIILRIAAPMGPTSWSPTPPCPIRAVPADADPECAIGQSAGEYSLMFFAGAYSHSVVKRPKPGDFRVQPHLGGSEEECAPPPGAMDIARAALAQSPEATTYARVDLLADDSGQLQIIELELIEPALWLQYAPDRGAAFAQAIVSAAERLAE